MSEEHQHAILHGTGKEQIPFVYRSRRNRRYKYQAAFEGVIPPEERKYFQATSELVKRYYGKYMVSGTCPDCKGARLKPEVKAVTIDGKSILDVIEMAVGDCFRFFEKLQLPEREAFIATDLLKEIRGPSMVLNERWTTLPHLRSNRADTVRRRVATDSASQSDRGRLARGGLCSRRTEYWLASAR